MDDPRASRVVLMPQWEKQASEFDAALSRVWAQGGWTVYVDETHYVDGELKLRDKLNRLLTQGREPGRISVVCGMQRPTSVTRFAIGEATHVISFGLEGRDAKILGEAATPRMSKIVERLGHHEFAWLYIPTRAIWTGKLNINTGQLEPKEITV